jgi:hypothetical protein
MTVGSHFAAAKNSAHATGLRGWLTAEIENNLNYRQLITLFRPLVQLK